MSGRLKLMLAVLAAIAALLVLDRPAELEVVEVSEAAPPRSAPAVPMTLAPAPALAPDAPIPDLFGPAPIATQAAPTPEQLQASEPPARPVKPYTLLGFRQEGQVRAAYLLRGDDVATVRAGDLLDRRYRVLALGAEHVDIKDKASGTSIRIGFEDHQ